MKNGITYIQRLMIILCCLASVACSPHRNQGPSYLFVLSAQSGVIQKINNSYSLTLQGIDPHVLWFTDRPVRKAGFLPVKAFIHNWSKGFKNTPPNAGVIHIDMVYNQHGKQQPLAVELSKPIFNGKLLTFTIKSLHGDKHIPNFQQLKHIKLFIDPPGPRLMDFHQQPLSIYN